MTKGFRQKKRSKVKLPVEGETDAALEVEFRFLRPKTMARLLGGLPGVGEKQEGGKADPLDSLNEFEAMAMPIVDAAVIRPKVRFGEPPDDYGDDEVWWDDLPLTAQEALVDAITSFSGMGGDKKEERKETATFRS